jgi:uncharacterized OB-fold protein
VAAYPEPRETPTNAPMLAAWREGALALQRCGTCGHVFFYPRSLCPKCWAADPAWFRADGRGRVVSFTRIERGLTEAFAAEAPVVLAEILLTEGAAMIARVITDDPAAMASGLAVRLLGLPEARRYRLPTFAPERGAAAFARGKS